MDFKSTKVNTRKPSTMQLLQNILNNAIFNCGLPFFLLARISSFSHSLYDEKNIINYFKHKLFSLSQNLYDFLQEFNSVLPNDDDDGGDMVMPRRHEKRKTSRRNP